MDKLQAHTYSSTEEGHDERKRQTKEHKILGLEFKRRSYMNNEETQSGQGSIGQCVL